MMRRIILLLMVAILLSTISSFAQDKYVRYEVFGGYSLMRAEMYGYTGPQDARLTSAFVPPMGNMNGVSAAFVGNVNSVLGIKVEVARGSHNGYEDFSGDTKSSSYFIMAGPQINGRFEALPGTLFGHGLFGVKHNRKIYEDGDVNKNYATLVLGGGVDWGKGRWGVRAPQIDYIVDNDGYPNHRFKISAGIVFRFGK